MKKINKKGFTLVELLAVIVVLIIIIFIAVNKINESTKKAKRNAIKANALSYIKAVDSLIDENSDSYEYDNVILTTVALQEKGVRLSGTKPDKGYVQIEHYDIKEACFQYGSYKAQFLNNELNITKSGECNLNISYTFAYTGDEQAFNVITSGTYKLEVWGAQGGTANGRRGGYGSYSVGNFSLNYGDVLYVNVGGTGEDAPNSSSANIHNGGYNGGGNSRGDGATAFAAGGGATSIALSSGLLSGVPVSDVLIVAGGGGGGGTYAGSNNKGGNAGGISGNRGGGGCAGYGGTQTAGGSACGSYSKAGSYGTGGSTTGYSSGGGGGYYGGGTGYDSGSAGGGGSGYIGNLTNASMYCYECTTSNVAATKTISNTCANESPTVKCSKIGAGYAKITYMG